jgi:polysaccharide export outer membrane protein
MRKFLLFLLLAVSLPGLAQQDSMLIGPGDVVNIQVFDTPNLNQTTRVFDSGELPLVLGGTVRLASMTTEAAAHVIEARLIKTQIMYHPQVLVTIASPATQMVIIWGQVARPGSYSISTPRPVVDVIALAGGITPAADRNVTIERADGSTFHYFVSNDPKTALKSSVKVSPGDRIVVPNAAISYVLGDVNKPGGFPTISNDSKLTALQAIAQAGGTLMSSAPNSARLIRKGDDGQYTVINLRVADMQRGKKPDIQLQANDVVYIPFSYLRNAMSLGTSGILSAAATAAVYLR